MCVFLQALVTQKRRHGNNPLAELKYMIYKPKFTLTITSPATSST